MATQSNYGKVLPSALVRPDWLAQVHEAALEPDLPIIDPHHHLSVHSDLDYDPAALAADIASGHRIEATIYIECRAYYRTDGPEEMRPVGETEHVVGMVSDILSDTSATVRTTVSDLRSDTPRLCAGIVAYADLMLGQRAKAVLEAHITAGGGRVVGIRNSTVHHPDPTARGSALDRPPGMLRETRFREGFACLAPLGLAFDSWIYHTQIDELTDLARAFPETRIVLDHIGGVLGIGPYAGRRAEIFATWRRAMSQLAACPNVHVKVGGVGMRLFGFGFLDQPRPPTSTELATAWRPYVEACIELFGTKRCMFESNFPVDKVSCSYGVLWNAFKRIAAGSSADEKADLFRGTAKRVYRL